VSVKEAESFGYIAFEDGWRSDFFQVWSSLPPLGGTWQEEEIGMSPCTGDAHPFDSCTWFGGGPLPGAQFRRVNGVWGEIAFKTGGIFCPLVPPAPSAHYDDNGNLKPEYRTEGSPQREAVINLDQGLNAVKCARDTLRAIPYRLVTDEVTDGEAIRLNAGGR
jgi:hypothetical protein